MQQFFLGGTVFIVAYNCPQLLRNRPSLEFVHLGHSPMGQPTSDPLRSHCCQKEHV